MDVKRSGKETIMKKGLKVLGIILAVLAVAALCIYFTMLRYPELKENPTIGKWYRVSGSEMKDSEGHGYCGFLPVSSIFERKLLI